MSHKRWITLGAVIAVAGVGAAGITQASFDEPSSPPDRGTAPAKAADLFSAFAQGDAAPVDPAYRDKPAKGMVRTNPDIDPSTLRLLRREGTVDVYAAAGTSTVCEMTRHATAGGALGGLGCGQAIDEHGSPIVHGNVTADDGGAFLVTALVPDGVHDVTLAFADGGQQPLVLDHNVVLYSGDRRPARLTYTGADGTTATDDYQLPDKPPTG
jgi:hypothetical protein